jgi:hypothetical protein
MMFSSMIVPVSIRSICSFVLFPELSQLEQRAPFGVSVIIHTNRRLVGLLWTSDQPVAEASTYTGKHDILSTRDKHPCPERDSNPRSP